jgi:hypothetical protein
MKYGEEILKEGMNGTAVQELQIRLSGFNGGSPDGGFGPGTAKQVKQFQKDFMELNDPDGVVDKATFEAIDQFARQYPVPFDLLQCKCRVCSGFGRGLFKGEYRTGKSHIEAYHKYEYPGIHRMLLWAYRAVLHYHPNYTFTINSGYRCSEDNKQHGRKSTNHCGKAIDLDVPRSTGETERDDNARCNAIRASIVEKCNAQIGWGTPNKKALEPENIAPTWVHYDVRNFASKYLENHFFCKTAEELDNVTPITVSDGDADTLSGGTTDETPAPIKVDGVVLASKLNVRAKPQGDGTLLGQVSKDDLVKVSETKNGWCQIEYRGKPAYVSARFIRLQNS